MATDSEHFAAGYQIARGRASQLVEHMAATFDTAHASMVDKESEDARLLAAQAALLQTLSKSIAKMR